MEETTEALLDAGKEVDLEVNVEKSGSSMLLYHQDAGQNHNIKMCNKHLETATKNKYVENDGNESVSFTEKLISEIGVLANIQLIIFCLLSINVNNNKYAKPLATTLHVILHGVRLGL
jgi:hypothetical protein